MARRWIVLPMAALTILLGWMASGIGKNNHTSLALAQNTGTAAERRTIFIERDPIRVIEEDPYSNFSGMAIDEESGRYTLAMIMKPRARASKRIASSSQRAGPTGSQNPSE